MTATNTKTVQKSHAQICNEFAAHMQASGITPPDKIHADGQRHRFSTNGKAHDKAGWYVLHVDGIPTGVCGDWRTGYSSKWVDTAPERKSTPEEKAQSKQRIDAARQQAEAERKQSQASTAQKAQAMWEKAASCEHHPYLTNKGVASYGLRVHGGNLLIPLFNADGVLQTLQTISARGEKLFMAGGLKRGGFFVIGTLAGAIKVVICEGYSTGASIHAATGLPVVCAMDAGNIPVVAQALRQQYAEMEFVFGADDDCFNPVNAGIIKATEAAQLVGGYLAVPAFGADRTTEHTDFNDLHQLHGLEAVKACIDAAQLIEPVPAQPAAQIPSIEECPCFRVFDDWVKDASGKATHKRGVWYFYAKDGRGDNPPTLMQRWICAPLYVEAVTIDKNENNYGRYLRFRTTLGKWRTWAMPMELLKADGNDLRGALLSMGLEIDPSERANLPRYLQHKTPKITMRCVQQTGWANTTFTAFAMPERVIGNDAAGIVYQSAHYDHGHKTYTTAGTLDGWRNGVSRLAVDNPMLLAGISAAFAGALLARCGQDGGGIHMDGDSSTGKSTIMDAACSVWGDKSYRRSWRTTDNGLEGIAAMFNDGLLALDEISEADPRQVGAMLYALGNGRGKQRATRGGVARPIAQWRCFVLSNGERSTSTSMEAAGQQAKAGQIVRLLNINVQRTYGAWDSLHGYATGADLAEAIKAAAADHHGHAGIAYLERLTRHHDDDFRKELAAILELPEFATDAKDGQAKRAAARLGVLALAGELATAYGITGWQHGAATKAAAIMFASWKAGRGNASTNMEGVQIREAVAAFIDAHGSGRFESLNATNPPLIHNRAGWIDTSTGSTIYLFSTGAMKEATKNYNLNRALSALSECGALQVKGSDGKRSTAQRINGALTRVYPIDPAKLLEV